MSHLTVNLETRFCTVAYPLIIQDPEYVIERILGSELSQNRLGKYVNKIVYGTLKYQTIYIN